MSAVYYPEGVKPTDLLPKIVQNGVVVAGGLHPEMAAKYFRIGHMGISVIESDRCHVERTLDALRSALKQCQQ